LFGQKLIVTRSALKIAGSKSQQFAILKIDTVFEFYKPKPPLSDFIDTFWLYEGRAAEQTERILPTGTLELAINLRQNELRFYDPERTDNRFRLSGAVVSGAHGRGFSPESEDEIVIIGVHFKPGGAFPFLGLPAGELADTHVDLETLWGRSAGRLRERLCESITSAERFQLLQEALLSRLCDGVEQHYAVSSALEMFGEEPAGPRVREVAKSAGSSRFSKRKWASRRNCSAGFSGFSKPGLSSNRIRSPIGPPSRWISDTSISLTSYATFSSSQVLVLPIT
jgi:hypothetical protein